jgi:hypothetical protein
VVANGLLYNNTEVLLSTALGVVIKIPTTAILIIIEGHETAFNGV